MTTPTIESFREAARIVEALGDTEAAEKYRLKADELEDQASTENTARNDLYENLYYEYYTKDRQLKEALNAVLDKLKTEYGLVLVKDTVDYDRVYRKLEDLDKSLRYRDNDGDLVKFDASEGEWRWSSSEDGGKSFNSHGPFKHDRG